MYFLMILAKLLNMSVFLSKYSYKSRLYIAATGWLLSYLMMAISFKFCNLDYSSENSDKSIFYMQLLGFWICMMSQSLAQATLVGYIRHFHADLIEPWGTGISIGEICDIIMSLYFNYFDINREFSFLYLVIGVLTVVPTIFFFTSLEKRLVKKA